MKLGCISRVQHDVLTLGVSDNVKVLCLRDCRCKHEFWPLVCDILSVQTIWQSAVSTSIGNGTYQMGVIQAVQSIAWACEPYTTVHMGFDRHGFTVHMGFDRYGEDMLSTFTDTSGTPTIRISLVFRSVCMESNPQKMPWLFTDQNQDVGASKYYELTRNQWKRDDQKLSIDLTPQFTFPLAIADLCRL